ncbi:hypothetical protein LR48_Vigan02g048800 [Vigna angularis]|uniref:Polycomb protein SUZ12-like zinc finger domain-containing protein n=1 Tax=Phaseolus angularis TaxID=3914 RepID=A0A0L9TUS5_PHAAN|nr:hypothetical protein LR48_Vigan02g048800 [Vigna angularis]
MYIWVFSLFSRLKISLTDFTEDFTCPFCLVKCSSFKGLRCHLSSSHDLFNFEFWVSDECHAVNVTVKNDISRSEIVADTVDPRVQTFFYCGKPLKRRTPKDPSSKNAVGLESAFPAGETDILEKDDEPCWQQPPCVAAGVVSSD